MTRKVWLRILSVTVVALIVVPSVTLWTGDPVADLNSVQKMAIGVMQEGATLFEPMLKEHNVGLDFTQTHYMLGEEGNFVITEVTNFSKASTDNGVILALVYASGDTILKALRLPTPGWYVLETYPTKEKEWKGFFLDQNGKEVAGFVAETSPAGAGHSLGVRCQVCLHIHLNRRCGEKVVPPGALSFDRLSGKIIS